MRRAGLTLILMALWPLMAMAGERGPVTGLPLPRYVSLKASEANVRRGPSLTHRIDWVFKRRDMPLRITAEFGHWRRVEDRRRWRPRGDEGGDGQARTRRLLMVLRRVRPCREPP